ncbi:MAG TPA: pilus assembly PilX N-terminal domain-containing protein [Nitrospirota bacterium]|nr:pilus assembly PilX N-terminal domain-containing protein [Nitrospirota bacterium]
MESRYGDGKPEEHRVTGAMDRTCPNKASRVPARRNAEKGIALVMALIISLVAFLIVATTLYLVTQSATMSGAGKVYESAEKAGDGSMDVMKNYIREVNRESTSLPQVFTTAGGQCLGQSYSLRDVIANLVDAPCNVSLMLPGVSGAYTSTITVSRLYAKRPPGSRIVFAEIAGPASKVAVFYRIVTRVEGPNNAVAENVAVYRYVP